MSPFKPEGGSMKEGRQVDPLRAFYAGEAYVEISADSEEGYVVLPNCPMLAAADLGFEVHLGA